MGRLFDAVASLVNLRQQMRFEGQPAMELEFAAEKSRTEMAYELRLSGGVTPFKSEIQNPTSEIKNNLLRTSVFLHKSEIEHPKSRNSQ